MNWEDDYDYDYEGYEPKPAKRIIHISLTVSEDYHERFMDALEEHGGTKADFVKDVIGAYLEDSFFSPYTWRVGDE